MMQRFTLLSGLTVFPWAILFVVATPGIHRGQSFPESQRTPEGFVSAWYEAVGSSVEGAANGRHELATHPDWEPYLRVALNYSTSDQKTRDGLRPVLDKSRRELIAWNLDRAKGWAKERRFDLLTTLAAALDDPKQAGIVGDLVTAASHDVYDIYRKSGWFRSGQPPPPAWTFLVLPGGGRKTVDYFQSDPPKRIGGDSVVVPADHTLELPATFIYGRRIKTLPKYTHAWLLLSECRVTEPERQRPLTWRYSVACVNDEFRLGECSQSLIVCDGDLVVTGPVDGFGHTGSTRGCVWICNGNVEVDENYSLENTMIYAAGDYKGSKRIICGNILTGGKNSAMDPKDYRPEPYFRENVKENPFGVRFVAPADSGVDIVADKNGVRLMKVEEKSPFAAALLAKGDRVTSLNGVKVATAAEFRRQLRECLVWGTGVVEAERGGTGFTRLVKFAAPPAK